MIAWLLIAASLFALYDDEKSDALTIAVLAVAAAVIRLRNGWAMKLWRGALDEAEAEKRSQIEL